MQSAAEAIEALRSSHAAYISWRRRRARAIRDWLIERMGGKCQNCPETIALEFHHPWGRVWTPRKVTIYNRMLRYRREYLQGNLILLCDECHKHYQPENFG